MDLSANAIELESKPAAHYAVAFHVRGSAYIQPAIQLVELTPGSVGHAWKFTMETDVRFAGASTPLGDLTVYAADIGGSAVGAADRFDVDECVHGRSRICVFVRDAHHLGNAHREHAGRRRGDALRIDD